MKIFIILLFLTPSFLFAETDKERIEALERKVIELEAKIEVLIQQNNNPIGDLSDLVNKYSDYVDAKDELSKKINQSNLEFEMIRWSYPRRDGLGHNLNIRYRITNNYDLKTKVIDSYIYFSDILGETIGEPIGLFKDKYIIAGSWFEYSGNIKDLSDSYARLSKIKKEDLKINFVVRKIAFEDGTILEFEQ